MIIKELFKTRNDGIKLYKQYSDLGVKLRQIETDTLYDCPVDIEDAPFTYEETDILIEKYNNYNNQPLNPDEISASEFMALVEEAL